MSRSFIHGWNPDVPDHRDHAYPRVAKPAALPAKIDLRPKMPPVFDQGTLGSCTANAIGGALAFLHVQEGLGDLLPSRLFIYYNERAREGTVRTDAGAQLRDGIKSVNAQGACEESLWPYDIAKFARKPLAKCYVEAKKHIAVSYQRLSSLNGFRACLSEGYPVAFGFSVSETFEGPKVARTGILPMPEPKERILGGHAVLAVGYDDAKERLLVRNSWGADWGLKGYFWMPYGYITEGLADDFWTIRMVK